MASSPASTHDPLMLSASGRPEPPPEASLVMESPRCARRFPGLGRWVGVAGILAFLAPIGVIAIAGLHKEIAVVGLLYLGMTGANFATSVAAALAAVPLGPKDRAQLKASTAGLEIARRDRSGALGAPRFIPRSRIVDGFFVPGFPPRVQIRLTGSEELDIDVTTEADGDALLSALAIGARRRRAVVLLGSPNQQLAAVIGAIQLMTFAYMMALPFVLIFTTLRYLTLIAAAWGLVALAIVTLARRAFRPTQVVVGRDGVRVQRSFKREWVPFTALESIELDREALRLRRRGAGSVVLRSTPDVLEGLARRIREAQSLGAAGAARAAAALERRGRPLAAWREALRGLLAAEAGYRIASFTPDDVLDALEDPAAPPDRRIGAAVALSAAGVPEARARIRIAAEASADEDLRAALEQAAEGEIEEAALTRALR